MDKTKSLIQSALNNETLDESKQQKMAINVAADIAQALVLPTAVASISFVKKDPTVIN